MNRFGCLRLLVLLPLAWTGSAMAAEISGVVENGTTGEPVPGQFVNLLALRGMMVPVRETQTDENGRYKFVVAAAPGERFLVQVPYRGVNYNAAAGFTSGERITANIEVFDAGAAAGDVRLEGHTIFLEPHAGHLRVTEYFSLQNRSQPRRSYRPEGGSFLFGLPETVGDLSVSVSTSGGMPLRQQPQAAAERNTFSIDYALRPGPTEIQISYAVPLAGRELTLRLPLLAPTERRHVAVPRAGVQLTGEQLTEIEQDQAPQARVYRVGVPSPGRLELKLTVDPSALEAAPAAASDRAPASSDLVVQIVPHPVNRAQAYVVGLVLVVLLLGLYYLYRFEPRTVPSPSPRVDSDRAERG